MVTVVAPACISTRLHLTDDEKHKVRAHLKSSAHYRRDFIDGKADVEGTDLTGSAKEFLSSYKRARKETLELVRRLGIELIEVRGKNNRRSLWSSAALRAKHLLQQEQHA